MKRGSIKGTYLLGGVRSGEYLDKEYYPFELISIAQVEPFPVGSIDYSMPIDYSATFSVDTYKLCPVRYESEKIKRFYPAYLRQKPDFRRWFLIHVDLIHGEDSQTLDESVIKQAISLIESDLRLWGILK